MLIDIVMQNLEHLFNKLFIHSVKTNSSSRFFIAMGIWMRYHNHLYNRYIVQWIPLSKWLTPRNESLFPSDKSMPFHPSIFYWMEAEINVVVLISNQFSLKYSSPNISPSLCWHCTHLADNDDDHWTPTAPIYRLTLIRRRINFAEIN